MKISRTANYASSFLIVSFAIWIAVSLRWILVFIEQRRPYIWLLTAMLALYGILLGFQAFIIKGSPITAHLYLGVQTVLIIIAMLLWYEMDFLPRFSCLSAGKPCSCFHARLPEPG